MSSNTYSISAIHEIKANLNIQDMFEQCFPGSRLKKRGNRLWVCCPFHQERTPSFLLDIIKNRYYCFGCHEHGDQITLYAKAHNISIKQAINLLAADLGLKKDMSPSARKAAQKAYQDRLKKQQIEKQLKALVEAEYKRLADIEKWTYLITKYIYCEEDLNRPAVIWALNIQPLLAHYIDILLQGTPTEKLKIVSITRRWDPWAAL